MGLPVVGLAVRLVANGIGVASEVIDGSKDKNKSSKGANAEASTAVTESSTQDPPPYTENSEDLPSSSKAQSPAYGADSKDTKLQQTLMEEYHDDNDDDDDSSADDSWDDDELLNDEDERNWTLDEATHHQLEETRSEESKKKYGLDAQPTVESLGALVLAKCPPPPYSITQLPNPVIIPQRRPGSKDRGFIHAYAPTLEGNGIPQDTFLSFIESLHMASKASPILNVVYLSAAVAGLVPDITAMITSTVVQAAVGAAIELQKRQRTNTFMDEMNEKLFKPRGLFALVMSYDPTGAKAIEAQPMNVSELIAQTQGQDSTTMGRFHKVGGKRAYNDLEMPEAAPLIFPSLDQAAASQTGENENGLKRSGKIVANYFDNRAQALYAKNYPDSKLTLPDEQQPHFASRFSDPNDPIHNGSIIALVTGGKVNPMAAKRERKAARREAKRERKDARREERGKAPKRRKQKGARKAKKSFKKNVLYLMIVNMPTEEELVRAKETLKQSELRHH